MTRRGTLLFAGWLAVMAACVAVRWPARPTAPPVVTVMPMNAFGSDQPYAASYDGSVVVRPGPRTDTLYRGDQAYPTAGRVRSVLEVSKQHLAWRVADGDREQWVFDGQAGPWGRNLTRLVVDADGRAWYAATVDGRVSVFADHRVVGTFYSLSRGPRSLGRFVQFTPDDAAAAAAPVFVGRVDGGEQIITPDGTFGPFQQVGQHRASDDKRHWACFVRRAGRWALLCDGRLHGWHDQIGWPTAGQTQEAYDRVDDLGVPYFTSDGQHLVWQTCDGRRPRLWLDDTSWPLAGRGRQHPSFHRGNDGSQLLWRDPDGGWWRNGERIPIPHGHDDRPIVGRAGAWYWGNGERVLCHLGEFGPYDELRGTYLTAKGQIVWAARQGAQWRLWTDGKSTDLEGVPEQMWPYGAGRQLIRLSRDGQYAYRVDGRVQTWYDELDRSPRGSVNGRHIAYQGRLGDTWYVVLDGGVVARGPRRRHLAFDLQGGVLLGTDCPAPYPDQATQQILVPEHHAFSADGKHWAHLVGIKLRVDGEDHTVPAQSSQPTLTRDGSHWLCLVGSDEGPWTIVADGKPIADLGRSNEEPRLSALADGSCMVHVTRGGKNRWFRERDEKYELVRITWPR